MEYIEGLDRAGLQPPNALSEVFFEDWVLVELSRAIQFASEGGLHQLRSPWTVILCIPVFVFLLDPSSLQAVVSFALGAFFGTVPYIFFAVLMVSYLKAAGAESVIATAFEGREGRMICAAALLGGLAPFCSCEVIPFIAGLLAMGAPLSAIMAFWLSSPLVDPPTILITASALGWDFAFGKAAAAIGVGLFGGFITLFLTRRRLLLNSTREFAGAACGCGQPADDTGAAWRFWTEQQRISIFVHEARTNLLFLVKWLALAYAIEALLVTYVPASLVASLVGGSGVRSIVIATLVGMPAYLNGYVAPPFVSGLIEQGMTPGAAMAFLVAGAISSIPSMIAVWSLVKPGVFMTYLALGLLSAILSGLIFQAVV